MPKRIHGPRGVCPACGKTKALNNYGRIREHYRKQVPKISVGLVPCEGSKQPPRTW